MSDIYINNLAVLDKNVPCVMPEFSHTDNDNNYILDENGNKTRLPDIWVQYDEIGMTHLGPIGIKKEYGFDYLDPRAGGQS